MPPSIDAPAAAARRCLLRAMAALLLLVGGTAQAQTRLYHVEVIVFRYSEPRYVDGEQWVVPTILPDFESATRLSRPLPDADDTPSDNAARALSPPPSSALSEQEMLALTVFRALPEADLSMGNIAGALRREADIDVMLHTGWLQPSYGNSGARFVYLDDLPLPELEEPDAEEPGAEEAGEALAAAPELDRRRPAPIDPAFDDSIIDVEAVLAPEPVFYGALRLRTGRLLAVDTDFVLNYEEAPVRLRESRRVLFRDTHYFDHPLFGVIVRILPYRPPGSSLAGDPEAAGAVEPAETGGAGAAPAASEATQGGVQ